jgi:hypothetical protein
MDDPMPPVLTDQIPVSVRRALRFLESHPSVVRVTTHRIEGSGATVAVVDIRTELANAWRAVGVSPSGVRAVEPVSFVFSAAYPLGAPRILLRRDFNRSHPHIQPARGDTLPEPCLVAGSPREVLRVRGMAGLFEQLVDWLEKAASAQLIDPQNGWEPVRRDGIDDFVVADADWLTSLPGRDGRCAVYRAWYYAVTDGEQTTYRIGLPQGDPVALGPKFAVGWSYEPAGPGARTGTTHAIVAWSGKLPSGRPFVAGEYQPENVSTIDELLARAETLGCRDFLTPKLAMLQSRMPEAGLRMSQPVAVLLLARRPCDVIGTGSPIEICPYVVELRKDETLTPGSGTAVRTAMHRDEISSRLLRRAAGDDGDAVRPWTLIGCGSVGSKLAVHLSKSGRGPASLVDSADMQPHNFARHGTLPSDNKVESYWFVPKALHLAESLGPLRQEAAHHQTDVVGLALSERSVASVVATDSFAVVNTTGSASVREALVLTDVATARPRVIEACVLGIGSVAMLSVEGPDANPSSTDLICEAYRAINADAALRAEVFNTAAEAIAIGQGCSAVTMPLSDARLSSLCAPMAERLTQLQCRGLPEAGELLLGRIAEDGLCQTWQRSEVAPRILVRKEGISEVRIAPDVDRRIREAVAARPGSETGGILVGRYSDVSDVFHVVDVLPAPPDSKFSRDEFVLGTQGLRPLLRDLIEGSGGALYALGTWHNHLVPSGPSARDVRTAALLCVSQFFPLLMLIHTPAGYVHFTAEALSDAVAPLVQDDGGPG